MVISELPRAAQEKFLSTRCEVWPLKGLWSLPECCSGAGLTAESESRDKRCRLLFVNGYLTTDMRPAVKNSLPIQLTALGLNNLHVMLSDFLLAAPSHLLVFDLSVSLLSDHFLISSDPLQFNRICISMNSFLRFPITPPACWEPLS